LELYTSGVEYHKTCVKSESWFGGWFSDTKSQKEKIQKLLISNSKLYVLRERKLEIWKNEKMEKEIDLMERFELGNEFKVKVIDIAAEDSKIYLLVSTHLKEAPIGEIPLIRFHFYELDEFYEMKYKLIQKYSPDYDENEFNCQLFISNSNSFLLWKTIFIKNLNEKIEIENSFGGGIIDSTFYILSHKGILQEKSLNSTAFISDISNNPMKNVEEVFQFYLEKRSIPNFNISNLTDESIFNFSKNLIDSPSTSGTKELILNHLKKKREKFEIFLEFLKKLKIKENVEILNHCKSKLVLIQRLKIEFCNFLKRIR
jgi:acetolactate synthase small subunit